MTIGAALRTFAKDRARPDRPHANGEGKIARELDYARAHGFADGIASTIACDLDAEAGCRAIFDHSYRTANDCKGVRP